MEMNEQLKLIEEHYEGGHEDILDCLGCEEVHDEHRRTEGDYVEFLDYWQHGELSECQYPTCTDEREFYQWKQTLNK